MNQFEITLMRLFTWVAYAALIVLPRPLVAQVAAPAVEPPSAGSPERTNLAVLSALRAGDLAQSLKLMESVGDTSNKSTMLEFDRFSTICAGINRSLAQLDSDAQFELLSKWSMPEDSPPRIRMLTALVPTISPPIEFARALGERPRSQSFAISSVGPVSGVFNSGWSLVLAARDSGRLNRLITDLGPMVDKQVPHAEFLMSLALIVGENANLSKPAKLLNSRLQELKSPRTDAPVINQTDVVLAMAALQKPSLQSDSAEFLQALVANSAPGRIRSFLRETHAIAVLSKSSDSPPKLDPRLKYWVPVSVIPSGSRSPVAVDGKWITHEDHILHLAGSAEDHLLFRFPLSGQYQFQCETQNGGKLETNGELVYGGYGFHAFGDNSEFHLTNANGATIWKRYCPFIRQPPNGSFNRLSLSSANDQLSVAVNLHPMWTKKTSDAISPWLGLASAGDSRPVFRNLRLKGHPEIPRSVKIAAGNDLNSWQLQIFGAHARGESVADARWSITDGILQAAKQERSTQQTTTEELFSFFRPLLAEETVSYEFFYEPGVREVSPALGRVAFLLQPDGVRIHWITDGDRDWTGLPDDNSVAEPLHRRGPRPLPLKANDWNRITLARSDSSVTLSLNETPIYQRPVDRSLDHRFGFYRPQSHCVVQVRNVELSGNWPKSVPQDCLDNPSIVTEQAISTLERHGLDEIFGDQLIAENVFAVRRKAMAMPVTERFEFLSNWILPSTDHPTFRVNGELTQTEPAPTEYQPGVSHPELGGEIVSPVFDWLNAAKELGKLSECRQKVTDAAIPDTEFQRRAREAILILLNLELDDQPEILARFGVMFPHLKTQIPVGVNDQWPETVLAMWGVHHFPENAVVRELISFLNSNRTMAWKPQNHFRWHSQIASLMGRIRNLSESTVANRNGSDTDLNDWIPVTVSTSLSRGQGFPIASWGHRQNGVVKLASHDGDFAFYRLPLEGNYELECDLRDMTQCLIAGKYVGLNLDRINLDIGTVRAFESHQKLEGTFAPFLKMSRFRAVVRDGTIAISINGRPVRKYSSTQHPDPWIAFRCPCQSFGGASDVRITGKPKVLDSVSLSTSKELAGWVSYHEEAVQHEQYGWTQLDDQDSSGWIVAHAAPGMAGTLAEGLLRYQRPLVEDGTIEYEFFYEPDRYETHPALDRLAFLLSPAGIREHWITDGRHDQTDLDPGNSIENSSCRRGPSELPLVAKSWNRLKLTFVGTTVRLDLNGQLVYERDLEPTNQRTFGLFHYQGNSEVRVRKALMRGDWPKTLPPLSEQELAAGLPESLGGGVPQLQANFTHDVARGGFMSKFYISPPSSENLNITPNPKGVQVIQRAKGPHDAMCINPKFTLSGDFDVEASFTGLQVEGTGDSGIMLNVQLDSEGRPDYRALRMRSNINQNYLEASLALPGPGGSRRFVGEPKAFDATSGRLRISRRGRQMYYLFSEGDSDQFFLFGTEPAEDADTSENGIFLHSFCNGVGSSQVIWTKIVLRAEQVKWFPPTPPSPVPDAISVMQSDGTKVRTLLKAVSAGYTNVAAPEWSADGGRIAFEMWKDTQKSSHIFVINSDGTELKDLGPGFMPSFSFDGTRIVCSDPNGGIKTMKSDGSERQLLNATGRAAQWSPDGNSIAFTKEGNVAIMNVRTREIHDLLSGDAAKRYASVNHLAWSHDNRSIAFHARRVDLDFNREELGIANVDSPEGFRILHPNADALSRDITFSPDNRKVLTSIKNRMNSSRKLFLIDRTNPAPISPFSSRLDDHTITGCCWSHDGSSIVITGQSNPRFVEWTSGPN